MILYKDIEIKRLLNAFLTIGARIVSVFLVIATTKILTTYLTETEYGMLSLYNVTATFPSLLFFGPLGQGIIRYYPIAREKNEVHIFDDQFNNLFWKGWVWLLLLSLPIAAICLLYKNNTWAVVIAVVGLTSCFSAYNTYAYGLQNAKRNIKLALGLETLDRVLQQIFALLLLYFVFRNPVSVIFGYAIVGFLFYLLNKYFYKKYILDKPILQNIGVSKLDYKEKIINYSWPFVLFGLFYWLQNASERWALGIMGNTEMVGQYAVVNQVGFQAFTMLVASIGYFIVPILFNKAGGAEEISDLNNSIKINKYFLKFIILATLFGVLFTGLFSTQIIKILSDEKYINIAPLLPFMVLAGGLFNYGQVYTNKFMIVLKTKDLIMPKAITSIIGLFLNVLFVWLYEINGLVVSVILTQLIYIVYLNQKWNITQITLNKNPLT